MRQKVLILFGAPGSGKSEFIKILSEKYEDKIVVLQKETTRPHRKTDGPEIKSVSKISSKCDFRYFQYDYEYGFSSKDIWEALIKNKSIVLIVNDIRSIRILNRKFGNLSLNVYVHSNINKRTIKQLVKNRYPKENSRFVTKDTNKRIEKIKSIHRKYISNTYLFDNAIINIYKKDNLKSLNELSLQVDQVYNKNELLRNTYNSTARILIIAGASFSGKDELVNALIQIEPNKVSAYKKGTTRKKTKSDKDELVHLKKLPKRYDISYEKNGYFYGIDSKEVWKILSKEKIVIIVLSDLSSILKISDEFKNLVSTIYLHSNIDQDQLIEAKKSLPKEEFLKRSNSSRNLKSVYINNLSVFDHVLLNTSEPEDLYDQAFNILDYYFGGI